MLNQIQHDGALISVTLNLFQGQPYISNGKNKIAIALGLLRTSQ